MLLGSTSLDDYPPTIPAYRSYTDNYTERSLLYGENVANVAIAGKGAIDGQGAAFEGEWKLRPYLIRVITSTNIQVRDITLRNSPMWMQHYLACDNVTIQGISVYNHCNRNNDFVDIDGCSDVLIENCIGDTDDDGITLKSTSARPCRNVTVLNCTVSSHCNAIKCGTESSGGFQNITIANCTVKPSADAEPIFGRPAGLAGIALEVVDGGLMESVTVTGIDIEGTLAPIFLRLGDRARPFVKGGAKPGVGRIRNVTIRDIRASGAGSMGCAIAALPGHPIQNLTLENLTMSFAGGGASDDIVRTFDEKRAEYPECKMFAPRLPAYGLYFWHVRNLTLNNLVLTAETPDARPAVAIQDGQNVIYDGQPLGREGDLPDGVLLIAP